MSRLETTISGKRLEPFYGNAAADYTRVICRGLLIPIPIGDETKDYRLFSELHKKGLLGFVTTKTLTSEPREGNPEPRFAWTKTTYAKVPPLYDEFDFEFEQGIQSMGLPNVGIYNYPFEKCDAPTIVSYVGKSKDETKAMTKYLDEKAKKNQNIIAVEYNEACPNVPGCPSCYKEDSLEHLKKVRENTDLPIFAKIGYFPEEEKLIKFGKKAEDIGIDGITAINSPPGMEINIETRKSVVKKYGGVFGRGLKPLALRTVNILHENTDLDVIGLGGIYEYSDAIEFLLAGANALEVCSKFISKVHSSYDEKEDVVDYYWAPFLGEFKKDIENYMERKDIKSLTEIIGKLEK